MLRARSTRYATVVVAGSILRKIWPYLPVGIGLGAALHRWAPEDFFTRWAGVSNPFAVLIAVVIGIRFYSNDGGEVSDIHPSACRRREGRAVPTRTRRRSAPRAPRVARVRNERTTGRGQAALPADVAPPGGRIRDLHPGWFASLMGTGIVAARTIAAGRTGAVWRR